LKSITFGESITEDRQLDNSPVFNNTNNMSRKVYLTVEVPLVIVVDEGVDMEDVMEKLTLDPKLDSTVADLVDFGPFQKWTVTDSK
jgi:hypothetical protein